MVKKRYSRSIFIFRRDLRLNDNIGLANACNVSDHVIPIFIFDPAQISSKNRFKSNNAIQFMLDSLTDLDRQLTTKKSQLYVFYGNPGNILKKIISQKSVNAVFVNKDYTPFSIKRDQSIECMCKRLGVDFIPNVDLLLNDCGVVLKSNKTPYTMFTPFFKNASKSTIPIPLKLKMKNFYNGKIAGALKLKQMCEKILKERNTQVIPGGRDSGLKILRNINVFESYAKTKDFPALDMTTKLSPHLKFGTVSIRECYHAFVKNSGKKDAILRQFFWRDFFTHIAFYFPKIFGHSFHTKYDSIKWLNDVIKFKAWCKGITGFPIVDAGMRQLNLTGFMHGRVRMIVASFLVKDLHIDWRWGEKYFATKLVDYDPGVNNGNWQWVASTGCDSQPYFRIFNPWLQQKKFDPDCLYIKKWIPELGQMSVRQIHNLVNANEPLTNKYPLPIINHAQECKIAVLMYKNLRAKLY